MATTVRASSSNSAATGTAISVSAPTGTTAGDVVVISVHGNGQTTIVDNNGSTPFTEDLNDFKPNTSSGHTVSIFSRRIQSGDPSTYNFTLGATNRWSIVAVTFQNPHATDIYDVAPSSGNANNRDDSTTNTINAPSINTNTDNAILIACGYSDDGSGGAMSGAGDMTGLEVPVNEPQAVGYKVITTAGATGTKQFTATTNSPMIALSFSIKDEGIAVATSRSVGYMTTNTKFWGM